VTIAACDVTDRAAVAALLDASPDLSTVVHAAGITQSTPIDTLDPGELARVTAAKIDGARHLDELLGDRDLDAFVLFSSIAGTWGSGGQGAYAAANAYLDALAERRRAHSRAATAIAWGPWAGGGMAADEEAAAALRRRGLRPMPPERALEALGQALDHGGADVTVADVDWPRFAQAFTAARPSPLIEQLAPPPTISVAPVLADRLADVPAAEREHVLLDFVRGEVAAVLGIARVGDVEAGRAFKELGFDSLTSVELRNRLSAATGVALPSTVVFDHPTAADLAAFVLSGLGDASAADGVHTHLDKIDLAISAFSPDDALRAPIRDRLQAMLSRLVDDGPAAPRGQTVVQHIDSATDDEMFEFIDKELAS
jgi:polyketide synthase 7